MESFDTACSGAHMAYLKTFLLPYLLKSVLEVLLRTFLGLR